MLKNYIFHVDGDDVVLEADDSICVKELIEILMERIDCYIMIIHSFCEIM